MASDDATHALRDSMTNSHTFPVAERVVYANNILNEVICQVRFPPVLRIQTEVPTDFQERIRKQFPDYEKVAASLPEGLPPQIAAVLNLNPAVANHRFSTEGGRYAAVLHSEWLAVSTGDYADWDEFSAFLKICLEAVIEVYEPSFFNRVGLRFQNLINPDAIGKTGKPWTDFVRKDLLGELANEAISSRIFEARSSVRVHLDNENQDCVLINHGLADVEEIDHPCYLIDLDYYNSNRMETGDALAAIGRLHGFSTNVFQWAISRDLHEAMQPRHP